MKPRSWYFMGFFVNPPHKISQILRIDCERSIEYSAQFEIVDLIGDGCARVCTLSALHARRDKIPMHWIYETN